jgi:CBS domain-containing membrane protein
LESDWGSTFDKERHVNKALHWLREFIPGRMAIDGVERMRASAGALIGILLTGIMTTVALGSPAGLPLLLAPMGASAVLLFALPASPLAQPWPVLGGNILSALIGVACARLIDEPILAAPVAVATSIAAMFACRCLHPPAGAIALMAVLGGSAIEAQGYGFAFSPVGINSALMLVIAILFNNATGRRYPHSAQLEHRPLHNTADAPPGDRLGFTPADLDAVLAQYNQVLDVSRDDLESLFLQAERHAYQRRYGDITCADIMSRDVIAVEYGTTLEEAWQRLQDHRIKALPVIDRARRVIGIVTLSDFMKHANLQVHQGFDAKLRQFIRRTLHTHSDKPEVVGQIMTKSVHTAATATHIVELVPLLSDAGLHHVPIIDTERRLAGMVTQSDIVAALYRGRLSAGEEPHSMRPTELKPPPQVRIV